jgi:hypothetical protein
VWLSFREGYDPSPEVSAYCDAVRDAQAGTAPPAPAPVRSRMPRSSV